jgi:hypothetical protein
MPECENCHSPKVGKSGKERGKQRYKRKDCGFSFVEGNGGTNEKIIALKALCVVLYPLGKGSYTICPGKYSAEIARLFIDEFAKPVCVRKNQRLMEKSRKQSLIKCGIS